MINIDFRRFITQAPMRGRDIGVGMGVHMSVGIYVGDIGIILGSGLRIVALGRFEGSVQFEMRVLGNHISPSRRQLLVIGAIPGLLRSIYRAGLQRVNVPVVIRFRGKLRCLVHALVKLLVGSYILCDVVGIG